MEKRIVKATRPTIRRKDLEYVLESMIEESLSYGEYAKRFEEKLSLKTETKYVVALNSLFNAFSLLLDVLEIKENDEVILPSLAPQVYLNVLLLKRIKPVLVDLEEETLAPSIKNIKDLISPNTKAILLIYYFGYLYDPTLYCDLAPSIILDISSAIGGKINDYIKKVTFSIADFSYKNIITTGDGSAIFCENKKNFYTLLSLIENEYTIDYKPRHKCLISDLNAAMGIHQCDTLEKRYNITEQIAKCYIDAIRKSQGFSFVSEIENNNKVHSEFPILVKRNTKEAIKFFKKNGVELLQPYEYPLHHYLGLDKKLFSNTEKYYLKLLLLPFYSSLLKKEVDLICKLILSFY